LSGVIEPQDAPQLDAADLQSETSDFLVIFSSRCLYGLAQGIMQHNYAGFMLRHHSTPDTE
jgi:hypothetical protein